MVLLIDNYDNFSSFMYQLVGSIDPDIKVIRSDELIVKKSARWNQMWCFHQALADQLMRVYEDLLRECKGDSQSSAYTLATKPSAEVFSGTVSCAKTSYAWQTRRSQTSTPIKILRIYMNNLSSTLPLLGNYWQPCQANYIVTPLQTTAEVMSVEHKDYPIYGVQFHPESIAERGTNDSQFLEK